MLQARPFTLLLLSFALSITDVTGSIVCWMELYGGQTFDFSLTENNMTGDSQTSCSGFCEEIADCHYITWNREDQCYWADQGTVLYNSRIYDVSVKICTEETSTTGILSAMSQQQDETPSTLLLETSQGKTSLYHVIGTSSMTVYLQSFPTAAVDQQGLGTTSSVAETSTTPSTTSLVAEAFSTPSTTSSVAETSTTPSTTSSVAETFTTAYTTSSVAETFSTPSTTSSVAETSTTPSTTSSVAETSTTPSTTSSVAEAFTAAYTTSSVAESFFTAYITSSAAQVSSIAGTTSIPTTDTPGTADTGRSKEDEIAIASLAAIAAVLLVVLMAIACYCLVCKPRSKTKHRSDRESSFYRGENYHHYDELYHPKEDHSASKNYTGHYSDNGDNGYGRNTDYYNIISNKNSMYRRPRDDAMTAPYQPISMLALGGSKTSIYSIYRPSSSSGYSCYRPSGQRKDST